MGDNDSTSAHSDTQVAISTVSLLHVQAHWAYSEIVEGTLSDNYDNLPNIEMLRAKRKSGIPLNQLTAEERYNLALLCGMSRPNLMIFMTGVDRLVEVTLNKADIATFLVPEMVSGTPGFMPLKTL
jgi:hypothetical protein